MGLLDGKRLLITGVLTDASLAFSVARLAQEEGADIVLSGAGRALSLTRRTARKLPREPEVLEIDVTSPEQLSAAGAVLTASQAACTSGTVIPKGVRQRGSYVQPTSCERWRGVGPRSRVGRRHRGARWPTRFEVRA